jgi:hypothetical protein
MGWVGQPNPKLLYAYFRVHQRIAYPQIPVLLPPLSVSAAEKRRRTRILLISWVGQPNPKLLYA